METKCVVIDSETTFRKMMTYLDTQGVKTSQMKSVLTLDFKSIDSYYRTNGIQEYVLYAEGGRLMGSFFRSVVEKNGFKIVSVEEYTGQPKVCLECGGTGVYVGFLKTEPCSLCCGGKS